MRNFLLISFCCIFTFNVLGQKQQTIESVDSLTYQQFFNKEYTSLQKTAKEALKAGLDFYFLRTRLAISYYNQKNYESALPHFKKAQQIFPLDTLIQEYYYFTLLFTGREEDAYDLAKHFSKPMQEKIGYKKKSIFSKSEISLTYGLSNNLNISRFDSLDIKDTNIYAEGTFQGGSTLASIVFKTRVTPRFNLTAGFSYYENQSMGKIQTYDSTAVQTFWNQPYQINLALDYLFHSGLQVGGAFGTYYESSNYYSAEYDSIAYTFNYNYNQKVNKPFTASLYLTYRWNRFEFFASGGIGNLASKKQQQVELGIVFYPLGNQHFYTITSGTLLFNDAKRNFIIHQKIGGKIYKFIWYELSGSYGNFHNYMGAGGFSTYNTLDPVLFSSYVSVRFYLSHFVIIPSYSFQIRENNYYTVDPLLNVNTLTNRYSHHILTLTAKWNF